MFKLSNTVKLTISFLAILIGASIAFFFLRKPVTQTQSYKLEDAFKKDNIIPVAILGSGPAGQSAAVYTSRLGYHTVIIEGHKSGGQLTETSYVENWPSEKKILGTQLMKNFHDQNIGLGVSFLQESIVKVDFSTWPYQLWTSDGTKLNALTVIISTGSSPKRLHVPGEDQFWAKGLTSCAVCDAPFYKGKNVISVGGGDSAAEQVLQLSPHVNHITLLVRGDKFKASKAMQDRLKQIKNLNILFNKSITKIMGDTRVNSVEILDNKTNEITKMPIDGIFLAIGHEPNTKLFKDQLQMDQLGYIKVLQRSQQTSVPGVYAAGDVEDHVYMQAGVAAGSGIKAGLDAGRFLQDIGFNSDVADKMKNRYYEVVEQTPIKIKSLKTNKDLMNELKKTDTPMILDFWGENCPSCKHMMPIFESLARKYEGKMRFYKVNVDEADELVEKLYILKVPSFVIYKNGQIAARYYDTMDKEQMRNLVEKFL